MHEDIFWLLDWGRGKVYATGISWVEVGDAATYF